jgi:uncharacterized membrane protein
MKETRQNKIRTILQFFLNPRLLLCLGLAWLITNGWSYIVFAIGTYFQIPWLIAPSSAYLAFLWLPLSPEKVVTVAIAISLLRFLFPQDSKTLAVLQRMHTKIRETIEKKRKK